MRSTTDHRGLANRTTQLLALAAAVPLLLLTAACGSSDDSPKADATPGGSAAAVPAALTQFFPGKAATGAAVKIGFVNPEGGPAVNQPTNRKAAEAAVKYANEQLGGIGGHRIELVECLNKEDPASARDCANQMVEAKVAAVIVSTTAQGESLAPIIQNAGIPYLTTSGASATELTGPTAFGMTAGFPGTLAGMAKYAATKGYKKVNVFVTDSPTVVGGVKAIGLPAFQAAGATLTVTPITPGSADATPQVTSALKGDPQANIIIGDATVCTAVLKALQTSGTKAETINIQPCMDPAVFKAVGAAVEGTSVFSNYATDGDDVEAQLYRYIMGKYAPGVDYGGYAGTGYQPTLALIRATASMTGDITAASVLAAMKTAKDVPLPIGNGATFTCDGKQFPQITGACSHLAIVSTVKDKKSIDPKNL
jgi:branched-chain amino acid transport system substrate-binding protein